jgi:hypothetical protein
MANKQIFNKGHALVIGVGEHKFHPENDVPITVQDAKKVKDILIDENTCGYPQDQVEFLHDDLATTEHIVTALKRLVKRVKKTDTVFFYFAGHGAFDVEKKNYYLATHDVKFTDSGTKELAIEPGTGLSQVQLIQLLKQIEAEKVLMIFNACHSGEIQTGALGEEEEDLAAGASLPDVTTSALLGTGEGRIVFSACKSNQLSNFLKTDNLTFFTRALAEGLTGKAASTDGFISAFNLYPYVYKDVTETIKPFGVAQEPMITAREVVGLFPVARANSPAVGSLGEAALKDVPPVRRVTDEESRLWMSKIERQTIVRGDYVGGDKVTGDKIGQQINTGGGAFFGGNVTAGHDVIGGDQVTNIGGDNVGGDSISVGDISGSSGVAIGRGASASVSGQAPSASDRAGQRKLLLFLLGSDAFTMDELQALSLLIGVPWVTVPGDDQKSEAERLVQAAENAGKLDDLKSKVVMLKSEFKDVLG